ncbi:MAG: amidase [Alphaproteobacteria bacterium]|nr:amidase [Alphaproteobacteria bacterium]
MPRQLDRSIAELARDLRAGKLKAAALAEEAIANHERRGKKLNAYKLWKPADARRTARAADAAFKRGYDLGPLQGIPVSVKDLYAVEGWPTYAGSPKRLPREYEVEGPIIRDLRRQLAVFPGKTHTVEFAYGGVGTNLHWGTPRNPWDAKHPRVPGGSSSGAGVSLCEGSALVALGSDTGGSVRIPASLTGNVGIKTTAGRWPLEGIVPLSPTLDTAGILTKSVADAAYAFADMDPFAKRLPDLRSVAGLRIGIADRFFWDGCSPGIVEGVERALKELERAGARLVKFSLPGLKPVYDCFREGGIVSVEFYATLLNKLPAWIKTLDPMVVQRFAKAREMTAAEFVRRLRLFEDNARIANARLPEIDALASPTIAITPPTMAEVSTVEGYGPRNLMILRNTTIGNLLRMCAVTMPVARDRKGMPVGLQLMAAGGDDARLLAIALACEDVLGDGRRRIGTPPMCR